MNTCAAAHAPIAPSPHPLAQMWHQLAARWAAHLQTMQERHDAELMAQLNEHTLRDIGAPERWVERAALRRETEGLRLSDLRQWRSG